MVCRARLVSLALAGTLLFGIRRARADCTPPTRQSTCVDADTLWVPAGPSPFVGIGSARAVPRDVWALTLAGSYLSRPVVLTTKSPDPDGRDVRVVDDLFDMALSVAHSPVRDLELSLTVPFVVERTGTGLGGVTSVERSSLSAGAFGDVRLGGGHALPLGDATAFHGITRLDVAAPTGGEFAGSRGVTVAPRLGFSFTGGPLSVALEEGARLRAASELGGRRVGSELVSTLGVAVDALPRDGLTFAAETWAFPGLLDQSRKLPDGTRITSAPVIPAEWMVSARTRLGPVTFQLGGGGAIPLSAETRRDADGKETTEHFAGVTTPRFRFTLVVRWTSE